MTTETINVKGMTCGGCVNSVVNALKGIYGVEDANVSLHGEMAAVTFDDMKTNVNVLKEAIEEAGYDVE